MRAHACTCFFFLPHHPTAPYLIDLSYRTAVAFTQQSTSSLSPDPTVLTCTVAEAVSSTAAVQQQQCCMVYPMIGSCLGGVCWIGFFKNSNFTLDTVPTYIPPASKLPEKYRLLKARRTSSRGAWKCQKCDEKRLTAASSPSRSSLRTPAASCSFLSRTTR